MDSRCGAARMLRVCCRSTPRPLLLDVAAPLSVLNTQTGLRGQLHRHGQVLLSSLPIRRCRGRGGAPRALVRHAASAQQPGLWRLRSSAGGSRAAGAGSDALCWGGDRCRSANPLVAAAAARGRCARRARRALGRSRRCHPSCAVDAAVVPFIPLGGDLRVLVGDSVLAYPPTRITVGACVEPLVDPLRPPPGSDRPLACLSSPRVADAVRELERELGVAGCDSPRRGRYSAPAGLAGHRQAPRPAALPGAA